MIFEKLEFPCPLELLFKQYTSPPASLVRSLDVIVAFTKPTLVTKQLPVFLNILNFVTVSVNDLRNNHLNSVNVKSLDGKETLVVLFKKKK